MSSGPLQASPNPAAPPTALSASGTFPSLSSSGTLGSIANGQQISGQQVPQSTGFLGQQQGFAYDPTAGNNSNNIPGALGGPTPLPGGAGQTRQAPFQSVNPSGLNNGFVTNDENSNLIRLMQQQQLPTAFANSQQQKVDELQRLQPLQQQKWDELNRTQPLQQPLQQPVIGGGLLGGNRQNLRERRRQ